jgi:hypothetical protein
MHRCLFLGTGNPILQKIDLFEPHLPLTSR